MIPDQEFERLEGKSNMTPDQVIERLDQLLNQHQKEHPGTQATLRITNTAFRACTPDIWAQHNWQVKGNEVKAILGGNDDERRAAFRSLLQSQFINEVEIVPGVDIIELVPNPATGP